MKDSKLRGWGTGGPFDGLDAVVGIGLTAAAEAGDAGATFVTVAGNETGLANDG
jgi:hypothetical protein